MKMLAAIKTLWVWLSVHVEMGVPTKENNYIVWEISSRNFYLVLAVLSLGWALLLDDGQWAVFSVLCGLLFLLYCTKRFKRHAAFRYEKTRKEP